MLLEAGVIVSIIGLIIGIYQWRKQRGDVRIELTEIQATIYIRVRADSPTSIIVRDIGYQVRCKRAGLRRFLSALRQFEEDAPASLSRRLKFAWQMRNLIAMGWCEAIDDDCSEGDLSSSNKASAFAPIVGSALPTTIDGYDDVSWAFDTRQYTELFRTILQLAQKKARLRFIVRISGHPRRVVKSTWLKVKNMQAFAPSNAWLFEGVEGLPVSDIPKRSSPTEITNTIVRK